VNKSNALAGDADDDVKVLPRSGLCIGRRKAAERGSRLLLAMRPLLCELVGEDAERELVRPRNAAQRVDRFGADCVVAGGTRFPDRSRPAA
jgi:hypothetical protein